MAVKNGTTTNGHSSKLPVKTREMTNHHMDSRIWNDVKFRPDDVIIATYAKSGTTWTQQIVTQLIFKGDPTIAAGSTSPWVDLRPIPREAMMGLLDSQSHRRCLKTHLPRDALVWNPDVKYIFVGRDGRDAIWSAHNHFISANTQFYDMFASGPPFDGPKLIRPSEDPRDLFQELLTDEPSGDQLWPFWSHIRGWWETRDQPNVLFLHFNDLKADLDGEMRKIAEFLDMPKMSEAEWNACVEHSTFDWMKKNADLAAPPQAADVFVEGAQSFIYKGTNSRWKDVLTEEECRQYEERAKKELGEECATWLQYGSKKPCKNGY